MNANDNFPQTDTSIEAHAGKGAQRRALLRHDFLLRNDLLCRGSWPAGLATATLSACLLLAGCAQDVDVNDTESLESQQLEALGIGEDGRAVELPEEADESNALRMMHLDLEGAINMAELPDEDFGFRASLIKNSVNAKSTISRVRLSAGNDGLVTIENPSVSKRIYALAGNDEIRALGGVYQVFGGTGNDLIEVLDAGVRGGNRQRDRAFGQQGRDMIAVDGRDIANGGAGVDLLIAVAGRPVLIGGPQRDEFRTVFGDAIPTIQDFNTQETIAIFELSSTPLLGIDANLLERRNGIWDLRVTLFYQDRRRVTRTVAKFRSEPSIRNQNLFVTQPNV